jgi:hypothetical protein
MNPEDRGAWLMLASIYFDSGQSDQGKRVVDLASSLIPKFQR